MKLAIVNHAGMTGKTTLTKHLLIPNLPGAKRIEIEDVNAGDGIADAELNAKQLKDLAAELNAADDSQHFVIDIGSSVIKDVTRQLEQLKSLLRNIDLWVVPVTKEARQSKDSAKTVNTLIELGVPASSIMLLPNKVEDVNTFDEDFEHVMKLRSVGVLISNQAVLWSEVFEMLKDKAESVYDLERNVPDFKSMKRDAAGDKDALLVVGQRMVLQDLAEFSVKNLNAVWADLVEQAGLTLEA